MSAPSGTFSVDLEQLDELITRLTRLGRTLQSVQADVQFRMNRVHAAWHGVAADEHAAAHARWRAGSEQVHEALQSMRSVAATAHENYSAAIRVNGALWARGVA